MNLPLLNKYGELIDFVNPDRIEWMKKNVADRKIKSMKEHALEMQDIYSKLI